MALKYTNKLAKALVLACAENYLDDWCGYDFKGEGLTWESFIAKCRGCAEYSAEGADGIEKVHTVRITKKEWLQYQFSFESRMGE